MARGKLFKQAKANRRTGESWTNAIRRTSRENRIRERFQIRRRDIQRQRTGIETRRRRRIIQGILPDIRNRTINRFIQENRLQDIVDRVKESNWKLNDNLLQLMWNQILGTGPYVLKIKMRGAREAFYTTLNSNSLDFFVHIMRNGFIEFGGQPFGSDVYNDITIEEIEELNIERKVVEKRSIENRDGRFFSYVNTTNIDLSRYQIFNQEQCYDKDLISNIEQCLIHTLKIAGVDESKINNVKLCHITGSSIAQKDLKKICDIIGKDITIHKKNKKNNKTTKLKIKTKNSDGVIDIGMCKNHYFLMEITEYSSFSIKRYDEVKDMDEFYKITKCVINKKQNGGKFYIRTNDKKMNSLNLVDSLFRQNYFKKLDLSKFAEASSKTELKEHIYLNNIENEQRLVKEKVVKKEDRLIYYADCESYTQGEYHELMMIGVVSDDNDIVNIYHTEKVGVQKTVYKFLNSITGNGKHDALVYFHNAKYDYHLLQPYLNIQKICEKDGAIYNVVCKFKGRNVEIRDSFKMIPFALKKFGKEFDLPPNLRKKEAIAYGYYNNKNINKIIKTKLYRKELSKKEQPIFKKLVKECPSYNNINKTFNPLTYYKEYLRLDCLVLKHGLLKFEETIKCITNGKMSIYENLTISSLTDNYMKQEGVYKGIYEMTGNLRQYISKAIYGGRVCVNKKYLKKVIKGKISDYDGVSLYPSAINRLCREIGLPMGKCKRFTNKLKIINKKLPQELLKLVGKNLGGNDITNWNSKIYSILTVKINSINKIQQMPFIAHKTKKNGIQYLNEAPNEPIIIDSITLQDYIKYHKIEYELIDGVYWDNGVNKKMGEVIQTLFNARLKAKKEKKTALSQVIKLMLNSSYGKTIMKQSNTEIKFVKKERKKFNKESKKFETIQKNNFNDYICNNFNTIINYRKINDNLYQVKRMCVDESYNRGHIGCSILSMSKRIMNEVFDVANDNELPIYYTDTDSLHCNYSDIPELESKYKERYGKVLNGKNLEQFHTDFDLNGSDSEIYATKSIFLGKKSYYDKLECVNKDGSIVRGSHIRLKGITKEGLLHESNKKKYKNGYEGLYEELAKGTKIKMTLNPFNKDNNSKKELFEYKNGRVGFRNEFTRDVQF